MKAKATLDQLQDAYAVTGNVHKVGDLFGMCGSSVHERLRAHVPTVFNIKHWSPEEDERLRAQYGLFASDGRLKKLSSIMNRSISSINNRAKKLGIQNPNRPRPYMRGQNALADHFKKNGHSRGMLGKKHTVEAKIKMADVHQKRWDEMSQAERDALASAQLAGRISAGPRAAAPAADAKKSWKAGWREIGPHRKYYRSQWEANYARYLETLRQRGEIKFWEHEPHTFWFEEIKRGVCSYKPDFRVTANDESIAWHEVKGWLDGRSKTALDRMAKYFPGETVIVIDAFQYKMLKLSAGRYMKDWEW